MDQRKYHLRQPSVNMDAANAVFIFLLVAQAAGGPVRRGAFSETIHSIKKEIRDVQVHLNDPELFPDIPCVDMNITEQVGAEPDSLTAHHLSPFGCYMEKVSAVTPELSSWLLRISQAIQDMELLESNYILTQNCSIPSYEQEMYKNVYAKCLVQLLDQWLSRATF